MKILAIGNSFSQDATRYLHSIAKADGMDMMVVNLMIGGCSLRKHYFNILENNNNYSFEFNGEKTNLPVTVKDALLSNEWDYVTIQQVSSQSPNYSTYELYLKTIADYIRKYAPTAKILIHQTWAYEDNSKRLNEELGYVSSDKMYYDLEKAYKCAKDEIDAAGIIPSGYAFECAKELGISPLHRDTFHSSFGIGRYIVALTWYKYLTGNDIMQNTFCDFDEEITDEDIILCKKAATKAVETYK
ncbi:MAG: DUF4886 domain-containing protein [Ruminococcaceae bacterium]|nr:DUF4886 domain-containing protein [Oscillospiraceae bacterium]